MHTSSLEFLAEAAETREFFLIYRGFSLKTAHISNNLSVFKEKLAFVLRNIETSRTFVEKFAEFPRRRGKFLAFAGFLEFFEGLFAKMKRFAHLLRGNVGEIADFLRNVRRFLDFRTDKRQLFINLFQLS